MTKPQPFQPVDDRTDDDNQNALSLSRDELRSRVHQRLRDRDARS